MAMNTCKFGYGACSAYIDGDCGNETEYEGSTGCAYANGNEVDSDKPVKLTCCSDGCLMEADDYIRWNGKCAYEGT